MKDINAFQSYFSLIKSVYLSKSFFKGVETFNPILVWLNRLLNEKQTRSLQECFFQSYFSLIKSEVEDGYGNIHSFAFNPILVWLNLKESKHKEEARAVTFNPILVWLNQILSRNKVVRLMKLSILF